MFPLSFWEGVLRVVLVLLDHEGVWFGLGLVMD